MSIYRTLVADRQTCVLYAAKELGLHRALKVVLKPAYAGLFEVPAQSIFINKGTLREYHNLRVRVAEFSSYMRGKLGKPMSGRIEVQESYK